MIEPYRVPGTDLLLTVGTKIKLSRFDTDVWTVQYGWYSWGGNRPVCGWYLIRKYDYKVKPLQEIDLHDIYVIESTPDTVQPDVPETPDNMMYLGTYISIDKSTYSDLPSTDVLPIGQIYEVIDEDIHSFYLRVSDSSEIEQLNIRTSDNTYSMSDIDEMFDEIADYLAQI